jgi:hypothetical protein
MWRPVVPIRVSGRSGIRRLFALLDTGADETKLPMHLAASLGVEINPREPAHFLGVGGQQSKGFYGKGVVLELRQGKKSYRWALPKVAFVYDMPEADDEENITITLGQVGFFRYFNVAFDNQRSRIEVRPNGLFRPHVS